MDTVNVAHHVAIVGGAKDWPATVRAGMALACTLGISWHAGSVEIAKYALGVVCVIASPSIARAILAPRLAATLKAMGE